MIDRMAGTLKLCNDTKGFGFITPNDGGDDLFVHQSLTETEGFRTLGDGESVEFQIESDSRCKTKAIDVTGTEEGPVQGKELLSDLDQLKHSAGISLYKQMGLLYEFILSTSEDGQILGWFFGLNRFAVFQDAGSPSLITMMYRYKRLFSCGTNRDGKLHMFKWDDVKCKVKKTYAGLQEASLGVVQFDLSRKYLAVADDHQIKVWDMDDVNLLTTIDGEGGLPGVLRCLKNMNAKKYKCQDHVQDQK